MLPATGARYLVVDTNILVRAAIGQRVEALMRQQVKAVRFVAPEIAFDEIERHLANIFGQRGVARGAVHELVRDRIVPALNALVIGLPAETYQDLEHEARSRLTDRDESDWPFLALAVSLGCPIWTEDQDFFGAEVPTWTTRRIPRYFAGIE